VVLLNVFFQSADIKEAFVALVDDAEEVDPCDGIFVDVLVLLEVGNGGDIFVTNFTDETFLFAFMSFFVAYQVGDLRKFLIAIFNIALVWFFSSVDPLMLQ
jgi:hypothetical protein